MFVGQCRENPIEVQIGDFDGDGRPDLITANVEGNSTGVLFARYLP